MYTEGEIAAELLRRRRGNENREPLMEEISEKNFSLTLNIFSSVFFKYVLTVSFLLLCILVL